MQCATCKYFAVPLTEEQRRASHCPGADPLGNAARKICTLEGKPGFESPAPTPEDCAYYFPVFMRFR